MKKFTSILTFLIISHFSFSQTHFVLSWSGNGIDQMTINVLSAKSLGINLQTHDEIAIFDGTICCGLFVATSPLQDFNTKVNIIVSKDEGTGNGYTSGHNITYKFWDFSESKEITNITAEYINIISGLPETAPTFTIDGSAFVNLTASTPVNHAPVANAGIDQIVNEGDHVTLNGSASSDPDGNAITYQWTAPSGIILSSNTASSPGFTAPEVNADTDFTFSLTVNDGTVNSTPDQIVVKVKQVNKMPVANAGADQSVNEGSLVTLDGTTSADPDQDPLSYKWTAPAGITLNSSTVSKPTFTAPEVTINTTYSFSLVVNDGKINSVADQVIVTVKQVNKPPNANAGTDNSVTERKTFQLDGSLSSDPDNNSITYKWTAPNGITISSTTAMKPTFIAPDVSTNTNYTFSLIVNDGQLNSAADQVVITVLPNKPPVANAGSDQTVAQKQILTLSAALSTDPENDPLTYLWTAPTGIVLSNTNTVNPSFTAPVIFSDTEYSIKLKVNDGELDSPEDIVVIKVLAAQIPIANAGNDIAVNEGTTVSLDGSGSPVSTGGTLTYKWTAPAGITLQNSNTIAPLFIAPEVNQDTPYLFSLVVNDGTADSQADQVTVTVKQVNKIPVANAGTDQTVNEGITVTLNGSLSTDGDGDPLTYTWTAPTGITLSTLSTPSFIAPEVNSDTQYSFKLTVSDGKSPSNEDVVVITIKNLNKQPIAHAGADQILNEGMTSSLDASSSSDPDGDNLTYLWIAPAGISLSSNTSPNPTFTAPEVNADKEFIVSLTVNDGKINSLSDELLIHVKQVNKPPVADAGTNQAVNEKTEYTFNGSGSFDPDGDLLTYQWIAPTGITLSSANIARPTFVTPAVAANTNFTFTLVVNDGKTNSTPKQVTITVKKNNQPPLANAGDDQIVNENTLVSLDGSKSVDPDQDALVYQWTAPEGIVLNSANNSKPTFTAPEVKNDTSYTFSLTVNDGTIESPQDQVIITVKQVNVAPVYTSLKNYFINENEPIALTLEGSDADNNPINFSIKNLPSYLNLTQKNSKSAILSGVFSSANRGDNIFQLTLSDGLLSTEETISIYVNPADNAPYVKNTIPDISVKKRDPEQIIDLTNVFADDDPLDILTYEIFSNTNEQVVVAQISGNNLILSFSEENTGVSEITLKASSNGKEASTTFKVEVTIPTGNVIIKEELITIYPNPTSGMVNIKFTQTNKNSRWITVSNAAGKTVLKTLANENEHILNMKGYPPGIYFIHAGNKNQKTYKIVLSPAK